MVALTEIENRIGQEFSFWRDGEAALNERLESYSFAADGSFNKNGIAQRRVWFGEQWDAVERFLALILPDDAPCVHSAISHLFMGPIEQDIKNLEQRDYCYCRLVETLQNDTAS